MFSLYRTKKIEKDEKGEKGCIGAEDITLVTRSSGRREDCGFATPAPTIARSTFRNTQPVSGKDGGAGAELQAHIGAMGNGGRSTTHAKFDRVRLGSDAHMAAKSQGGISRSLSKGDRPERCLR